MMVILHSCDKPKVNVIKWAKPCLHTTSSLAHFVRQVLNLMSWVTSMCLIVHVFSGKLRQDTNSRVYF